MDDDILKKLGLSDIDVAKFKPSLDDLVKNNQINMDKLKGEPQTLIPNIDTGQIDRVAKEISRQKDEELKREIELTESSKETVLVVSEFKKLVEEFIEASEEQTKSTNNLNKRLFWFTLVSVIATVISTVIAIIQFIDLGA